jgi:hypothetical protein
MKKYVDEILGLSWTLGGTSMVLITLSGETLKWGLWIAVASLTFHLIGTALKKPE